MQETPNQESWPSIDLSQTRGEIPQQNKLNCELLIYTTGGTRKGDKDSSIIQALVQSELPSNDILETQGNATSA